MQTFDQQCDARLGELQCQLDDGHDSAHGAATPPSCTHWLNLGAAQSRTVSTAWYVADPASTD